MNHNCDTFRRWKHPGFDWMQGEEGKEAAEMAKIENVKEGLRKDSDFRFGYMEFEMLRKFQAGRSSRQEDIRASN